MNRENIIKLIGLILFLVILYKLPQFVRLPFISINPIEAIPSDSPVFFEIENKNIRVENWKTLSQNNKLCEWSVIQKIESDLAVVDTLFGSAFSSLKARKLTLALGRSKAEELDFLYILDGVKKRKFLRALPENIEINQYSYNKQTVNEIRLPNGNKISYSFYKNLLLFARYSVLIEDAISQLQTRKSNLLRQGKFRAIYNKKCQSNNFNLYLNPSPIYTYIKPFTKPEYQTTLQSLAQKWDWLSIQISNDAKQTFLQAKSIVTAENEIFTNYSNDIFQGEDFATILNFPKNTMAFNTIQISKYLPKEEGIKTFWQTNFTPWLGNEITQLYLEGSRATDSPIVLLECQDAQKAEELLVQNLENKAVEDYNSFLIYQFQPTEDLAKVSFLKSFNKYEKYFVIFDNLVAVCNKKEQLKILVNSFAISQNLSLEESFLNLYSQLQNQGAIYTFFSPKRASTNLKNWMKNKTPKPIENLINLLQRSNPILCVSQLNQNTISTKAIISKDADSSKETNILWTTNLEANAATSPQIIAQKEQKIVLIQDAQNTLYALDEAGSILWKRPLSLKLKSQIFPIDLYGNGDTQFLFNTKEKIYLIDQKGKDVSVYPIGMQCTMYNGLIAIDFDASGKQSYFVACENGNIYGFSQKGVPLTGWNPNKNNGQIKQNFQHFQYEHKDYILSLNTKDDLQVYQRNGKLRFPSLNIEGAMGFSFENTPASTRIVVSQKDGKVTVVNTTGQSFKLPIVTSQSTDLAFCFADLVGDGRKDYFMLHQNKINGKYYEKNKLQNTFEYSFQNPQDTIFALDVNAFKEQVIASLSKAEKQINIIGSNGNLLPQFPLAGTTLFQITNFKNDENVLVVGHDNSVVAYRLGN